MKKIFFAVLTVVFAICHTLNVSAVAPNSYSVTVTKNDSSGSTYILYILSPSGHYDSQTDTATVYITNTSGHEIRFEMFVGYAGNKVKTDLGTGEVKIPGGVTACFSVSGLKDIPEKANDDLGYVPYSHLKEGSAVRICAKGIEEGDTFTVSGIVIGDVRNTYFDAIGTDAVESTFFDADLIENAKTVIPDENDGSTETNEPFGIVLEQPSNESVTTFITIVAVSAGLFIGGAAIYICSMIIRRRKDAGN